MAERMTDTGAITATGGEQAGTRGGARLKARIATWHRWLGLILTIPLLGWIMSSAAMMLITMNAPNGLAGVYTLRAFNSVDVPLTSAGFGPDSALRLAAGHGVDRAYWVRLQSRGTELWYVVKPSPYAAALVFDARTGQRLDPLSDKRLTMAANDIINATDVIGDTRLHFAGACAREERERLTLQVLVDVGAQVVHDLLPNAV